MKNTLLLLLLLCNLLLRAQTIDTRMQKLASVNYDRLARIDTLVQDYLDKDYLKGCVVLVVKNNQLVLNKGYGYADAATQKPMKPDALFRIMSQTKAFTSAGILKLYEEGKLLLDDPVSKYIPAFAHQSVIDSFDWKDSSYSTQPANRDITIRDLLTHSSGIDYVAIGSPRMQAVYAKAGLPLGLGHIQMTLLESMQLLAKQPLDFQPGTKWRYGLNTDLLGCLIEVISKKPLADFLHDEIFAPLGMSDTYFTVPMNKKDRLATLYTEDENGRVVPWSTDLGGIDPDFAIEPTHFYSGGAGSSSTALDYAKFLQCLLNKGRYNGYQLLAPRTVEMMTTGQLPFLFNGVNQFGLGFEIVTERGAALNPKHIGTFSWGGYYGTTYWADPVSNMVCLVMTQHAPNSHGDLVNKIQTLIYAALKD